MSSTRMPPVICLNFLLLLTYREPGKQSAGAQPASPRRARESAQSRPGVVARIEEAPPRSLPGHLLGLVADVPDALDVLPKYVEDWVDTSGWSVSSLAPAALTQIIKFLLGMDANGLTIQPEGIVNINSGMIMLTCFLFGRVERPDARHHQHGRRDGFITAALCLFGLSNHVGLAVLAMVVFSVGEMLASPKFSEFLGNIAPPTKRRCGSAFPGADPDWLDVRRKNRSPALSLFSSKDISPARCCAMRLPPDRVTTAAARSAKPSRSWSKSPAKRRPR